MLISHDLTAGPELLTIKIRVALTTKSISLDSAAGITNSCYTDTKIDLFII